MKQFISSAILFLALIFTQTLFAKVIFVNGSYTGSTANGNSWSTPYKKLEIAIAAATDGDEVWVAKGTYVAPTYKSASGYFINNSISIYGGFIGTETSVYARDLELNKTIAKGFDQGGGTYLNIFSLKPNKAFVIDGFNLTNFSIAVFNYYYDTISGNSITNLGDRYNLTFNNCNVYDGKAPITFLYTVDLVIQNSVFFNNQSEMVVSYNSADLSSIKFENSKFDMSWRSQQLLYASTSNLQAIIVNLRIAQVQR